jgi:hypothetical protein
MAFCGCSMPQHNWIVGPGRRPTSIVIIGDKGSAAGVESIANALAEAAASEPVKSAYREPLRAVAQTDGERVT